MKKQVLIGLTALLTSCATQESPKQPKAPKQYNTLEEKKELAQCLVREEATMFGAYWCPACYIQEEKILGPEAWDIFKVNYIECSEKSSQEEIKRCQEVIVDGRISLPTWKFKDGTTITGYQTLETLAKLSKCD